MNAAVAQSADQELDAIALFAPWAGPDDRPLRLRIHKAWSTATARATRCRHRRARLLYGLAAEIAGDWVFLRAEVRELEDVLAAITRMFLTAGWIERCEAPDEY
jgi:hypothetical protein